MIRVMKKILTLITMEQSPSLVIAPGLCTMTTWLSFLGTSVACFETILPA